MLCPKCNIEMKVIKENETWICTECNARVKQLQFNEEEDIPSVY